MLLKLFRIHSRNRILFSNLVVQQKKFFGESLTILSLSLCKRLYFNEFLDVFSKHFLTVENEYNAHEQMHFSLIFFGKNCHSVREPNRRFLQIEKTKLLAQPISLIFNIEKYLLNLERRKRPEIDTIKSIHVEQHIATNFWTIP